MCECGYLETLDVGPDGCGCTPRVSVPGKAGVSLGVQGSSGLRGLCPYGGRGVEWKIRCRTKKLKNVKFRSERSVNYGFHLPLNGIGLWSRSYPCSVPGAEGPGVGATTLSYHHNLVVLGDSSHSVQSSLRPSRPTRLGTPWSRTPVSRGRMRGAVRGSGGMTGRKTGD